MKTSTSSGPFSPAFAVDWEQACRADAELNHLGGRADICFAVHAGAAVATVEFADGKLRGIRAGAKGAVFTLCAPMEVWERFLQAVPPAPYHHVLAMKMRVPEFSVAGDEQKLLQFAHLVRRSLELARWLANGRAAAALHPTDPWRPRQRVPSSPSPVATPGSRSRDAGIASITNRRAAGAISYSCIRPARTRGSSTA